MRELALLAETAGKSNLVKAAGLSAPEESCAMRYGVGRPLDAFGLRRAASLEQGLACWATLRRLDLSRELAS
jgi:hypothetical protein